MNSDSGFVNIDIVVGAKCDSVGALRLEKVSQVTLLTVL